MANLYVSTTGNDTTGDGSVGNPWATPLKAYTELSDGDTVYFEDGSYDEPSFVPDIAKSFTFEAINKPDADGFKVTFDGSGGARRCRINGADNVSVSFSGIKFYDFSNSVGNDPVFSIVGQSGCVFNFTQCSLDKLRTWCTQTYLGAALCGQNNNGQNYGITINMDRCVINDFERTATSTLDLAIYFTQRSGPSTLSINLTNVTIYQDGTSGLPMKYFVGGANNATGTLYLRNVIIRDGSGNLTWKAPSSAALVATDAANSCINGVASGAPTGTGVITSDPLFIDEATGDFRLKSTSPCRGSGTLI